MITADDRTAITAALGAAEERTSGQIVCVLAQSSSDYSYVPLLWAAFLALACPWPLIIFTQLSVQRIYLLQIASFIVAALVLAWYPFRMMLVPRAIRRAQAHRAAMEQFFTRGVTRTRDRTGILIFVSLAEHYARIVADEGIASRVKDSEWQAAVDELTSHMRNGRVAQGLVAAIERCGSVLAEHAPPSGAGHELPEHLYVVSF